MMAVDAHGWMHKGARTCARELCLNIPTTRFADYFLEQVDRLLSFGLIPTLVFDGAALPAKSQLNHVRGKKREAHLISALNFESQGNLSKAKAEFKDAVRVTPEMILVVLNALKERGLNFLVSPYEADSQLAFLSQQGLVDAVIADDVDMVPYGCKRVLFKLNWNGCCTEFRYDRLCQYSTLREALPLTHGKTKKKVSSFDLSKFTHEQIIRMCVFAGCDYISSVNGIKIGRAYELARDFQDFEEAIEFEKSRGLTFPKDYADSFRRAVKTYLHQTVFNPDTEETVHLSPITDISDEEDLSYLGLFLPKAIATGIAYGLINPHTQMLFGNQVATESVPVVEPESVASLCNEPVESLVEEENSVVVEEENLVVVEEETVLEPAKESNAEVIGVSGANETDTVEHSDRQQLKDAAPVAPTPAPTPTPTPVSTNQKVASEPALKYTTLGSFSWDQDNDKVKISVFLEGVDQEKVQAEFNAKSVDIKFHDVQGKNYRCAIPNLNKEIVPEKCKVLVKPTRVVITLVKASKGNWLDLHFKEDKFKPNLDKERDPMAGIMDLMKNMYEDGDDEMKKTIAKAWTVWQGG